MKKEKMLVKRKSTGNWSFKQIMMFGFAIIVFASIIFMQADNASAAKKKIKQVNNSASTSLKKGVLTVSGKGKMTKKLIPTQAQKKKIKKIITFFRVINQLKLKSWLYLFSIMIH